MEICGTTICHCRVYLDHVFDSTYKMQHEGGKIMKQKWTAQNVPSLQDKIIIVTGANSGIGLEATKIFLEKGAHVIMACRNLEKSEVVRRELITVNPTYKLDLLELNLSSFSSIKSFSDEVLSSYPRVDILLNNAGVMTTPYRSTEDGLEQQIGINHFGHFYLTMLLLEHINKTKDSRVVNIASIAHKFGNLDPSSFYFEEGRKYSKTKAYSQSKLANLLFTYQLKNYLLDNNMQVSVLAAHPGVSRTNLGRHIKALRFSIVEGILRLFNQSAYKGCLPGVRACTDPTAQSGDYFGPSGFFEFKGHPVKVKSTKKAQNKELQKLLWEHSMKITKLKS